MFCVFFFNKKKKLVNRPSPASSWQSTAHPCTNMQDETFTKKKRTWNWVPLSREAVFVLCNQTKANENRGKAAQPSNSGLSQPNLEHRTRSGIVHAEKRRPSIRQTWPSCGAPGHGKRKRVFIDNLSFAGKTGTGIFFCVCVCVPTHTVCKSVLEFYDAFQVVMTCWRRPAASLSPEPACWPILGVLTPPSLAWSCCFLVLAFWP